MPGLHEEVEGAIYPGGLLTLHGVMKKVGLGRRQVMAARAAGVVKPKYRGGRAYYETTEIMAWIRMGANSPDEDVERVK